MNRPIAEHLKSVCRICGGKFNPTPSQSERTDRMCRSCGSAYRRDWYARRAAAGLSTRTKAGVERLRADKHKQLAGGKVRHEVKMGRIKRTPCEVCGETKTQGHHDDYSKPLEVRWLCAPCHKAHHLKLKGVLPPSALVVPKPPPPFETWLDFAVRERAYWGSGSFGRARAELQALRERAALADEARHLMDHGEMDEVRSWEDRYDALTARGERT